MMLERHKRICQHSKRFKSLLIYGVVAKGPTMLSHCVVAAESLTLQVVCRFCAQGGVTEGPTLHVACRF